MKTRKDILVFLSIPVFSFLFAHCLILLSRTFCHNHSTHQCLSSSPSNSSSYYDPIQDPQLITLAHSTSWVYSTQSTNLENNLIPLPSNFIVMPSSGFVSLPMTNQYFVRRDDFLLNYTNNMIIINETNFVYNNGKMVLNSDSFRHMLLKE